MNIYSHKAFEKPSSCFIVLVLAERNCFSIVFLMYPPTSDSCLFLPRIMECGNVEIRLIRAFQNWTQALWEWPRWQSCLFCLLCVFTFLSGSPLQEFEFNMTSTFLSKVSSKYMKSKWHLYPSQVKLKVRKIDFQHWSLRVTETKLFNPYYLMCHPWVQALGVKLCYWCPVFLSRSRHRLNNMRLL